MAYLGSFEIDEYVYIPVDCHRFSTGAAYAPTVLTYTIYEDNSTTHLVEDVDMTPASPFDAIVGHYLAAKQLTAVAGFESGKFYHIVVKATVDSIAAITTHTFQIGAKVNMTRILNTLLSESSSGYLTAGFKKLFDVATPVLTCACVNQTIDNPTAAAIATGVWQDATDADFTTANSIGQNLKAADGAVPGAAGGLFIVGENIGNVSIAPTSGNALTLTGGTTNSAGLKVTGLGSGSAVDLTGGATGNGMLATGGSGTGGAGIKATGGGYGYGLSCTGTGASAGLYSVGAGGQPGISVLGQGAGAGLACAGGATGVGLLSTGGTTLGATAAVITGSGAGISGITGVTLAATQTGVTIPTVTTVTGGATSAAQDTILAAVSGIGTAGGAAINVDANDDNVDGGMAGVTVATTVLGTVVGALTNTSFVNTTYQTLNDDGAQTTAPTIAYQFLCGGGTSPVSCKFVGYVNNTTARKFTVQAWKFGTGWEDIGEIIGQSGTTDVTKDFVLYSRHVGTAAGEVGKVYIRFLGQGTNTPKLYVNQLAVSYSITSRTVGYTDGAVWIKAAGTALAEVYVNGTADNPCPYANAKTVAAAIGLTRFRVVNGEAVTLDATAASQSFIGKNWTLALGSQAITGAYIEGATVSGISSGTGATFVDCVIGSVTVNSATFIRCRFTGTFTMIASGAYNMLACVDGIPGTSNATMKFAASATLGLRAWAGGIDIETFAATNVAVIDGSGKIILKTDCRDGDMRIRGPFAVQIDAGCTTVPTQTENLNSTTIQAMANAALVANSVDHVFTDTTEILTRLPDATPGAATGLMILGANTGDTTFTPTSNAKPAIKLTGKTTGSGLECVGGTAGNGMELTGNGAGDGMKLTAGLTGIGVEVVAGGTSGDGISVTATDGNGISVSTNKGTGAYISAGTTGPGMELDGAGAGAGLYVLGGNDAAGHGMQLSRGNASADDLKLTNSDAPTLTTPIADAVCDEAVNTGHATANTVGKIIYDLSTTIEVIP